MTTSTQISSNQIVQQPEIFREPGSGPAVTSVDLVDQDVTDEFDEDAGSPTVSMEIEAPETLTIESQQVRKLPDGQMVIDVILDVEEVLGATNYEIRFV